MAVAAHVALGKRQSLAGGDAQHGLDDIDAGHHFGDGVLDLQARIHLQEIIADSAQDEFDRADPAIIQALAEPHRVGDHSVAKRCGKIGGRGFLDELLVTPLQRAFTLEQVNYIAFAVTGDLYFDMAPLLDQFFDDQPGIAKRIFGLAHGRFDFTGNAIEMRDGAHALAAASRRGFQHHRKPDFAQGPGDLGGVFARRFAAGNGRHTGRFGLALGGGFVPEPLDDLGRRASEDQPCGLDGARECGIFGEKTKTGMDRLRARRFRGIDHGVDPQIAVGRGRVADLDGLADHPDMQSLGIGRRVDTRDRNSQPVTGSRDAAGDFTAIGDQNFLEHLEISSVVTF